jgi:hypothetical protein
MSSVRRRGRPGASGVAGNRPTRPDAAVRVAERASSRHAHRIGGQTRTPRRETSDGPTCRMLAEGVYACRSGRRTDALVPNGAGSPQALAGWPAGDHRARSGRAERDPNLRRPANARRARASATARSSRCSSRDHVPLGLEPADLGTASQARIRGSRPRRSSNGRARACELGARDASDEQERNDKGGRPRDARRRRGTTSYTRPCRLRSARRR